MLTGVVVVVVVVTVTVESGEKYEIEASE